MAHNQIVKYLQSYAASDGNTGFIVAGEQDLLLGVGSTGIAGICVDLSGNIFLSDSRRHIIIRVTPNGIVSTYAGQIGQRGNNGDNVVPALEAKFADPGGIAVDKSGNLYIADHGNNQIRVITGKQEVSLLAGSASGVSGFDNAFAPSQSTFDATFNAPSDVAVDNNGVVFVADSGNHAIRMIRNGNVFTWAGTGAAGDEIGPGTSAQFDKPFAVTVDKRGRVYVSDQLNRKIKVIDTKGEVSHFSGSGSTGFKNGNSLTSSYHTLKYSDIDPSGNLYVVDFQSTFVSRIRKIDDNGNASTPIALSEESTPYANGVAVDRSGIMYVAESIDVDFESSSSSSLNSSSSSVSSQSTFSSINSSSSSQSSFNSSSSSLSSINSSSSSLSSDVSSLSSGIVLELNEEEEIDIGNNESVIITFVADEGKQAIVVIDGVGTIVANVDGFFVWNPGGLDEFTFTTIGETIIVEINGNNYSITWNGNLPTPKAMTKTWHSRALARASNEETLPGKNVIADVDLKNASALYDFVQVNFSYWSKSAGAPGPYTQQDPVPAGRFPDPLVGNSIGPGPIFVYTNNASPFTVGQEINPIELLVYINTHGQGAPNLLRDGDPSFASYNGNGIVSGYLSLQGLINTAINLNEQNENDNLVFKCSQITTYTCCPFSSGAAFYKKYRNFSVFYQEDVWKAIKNTTPPNLFNEPIWLTEHQVDTFQAEVSYAVFPLESSSESSSVSSESTDDSPSSVTESFILNSSSSISSTSSILAPAWRVDNAPSKWRGIYSFYGQLNSKNAYVNQENGYAIFWGAGLGPWYIGTSLNAQDGWIQTSGGDEPIAGGWANVGGGTPFPRLVRVDADHRSFSSSSSSSSVSSLNSSSSETSSLNSSSSTMSSSSHSPQFGERYTLSGFIDAFNKTYVYSGMHNGKPYFRNNIYFISWSNVYNRWQFFTALATSGGGYYYKEGPSIEGQWNNNGYITPAGVAYLNLESTSSMNSSSSLSISEESSGVEGFMVSSAGNSAVNGTYCLAGTFNGSSYYEKSDGTHVIYNQPSHLLWALSASLGGNAIYYHLGSGGLANNSTGWTTGSGAGPAPLLAATVCEQVSSQSSS